MINRLLLLAGLAPVPLAWLVLDSKTEAPELQLEDLTQNLRDWRDRGQFEKVGDHRMFYLHEGQG